MGQGLALVRLTAHRLRRQQLSACSRPWHQCFLTTALWLEPNLPVRQSMSGWLTPDHRARRQVRAVCATGGLEFTRENYTRRAVELVQCQVKAEVVA